MCGRATLTNGDIDQILRELDAEISPDDAALFRPRYNMAPSDLLWIVEPGADRRVIVPAVWGYLASGRPLINVRGEQAGSGRGFREAFASRRCLVVTDGFFEWDAQRAPTWFHRSDGGLVLLAGLYQSPAGGPAARPRFTILTTRPNRLVARVHNRMPVVISSDRIDDWLRAAPSNVISLIEPAPESALVATAVSRRVNSVKNDDPGCLAPAEPTNPPASDRQGSLF